MSAFWKFPWQTQECIWEWDILEKYLFWGDGFKEIALDKNYTQKAIKFETWSLLVPQKPAAFFDKSNSDRLKDRNTSFLKKWV